MLLKRYRTSKLNNLQKKLMIIKKLFKKIKQNNLKN